MADNVQRDSADIMGEKLEKWRRMKGKRSVCEAATTVYNRSKSAVALGMTKNSKSVTKRFSSSVSLVMNGKNKGDKKGDTKGLLSRPEHIKVQTKYKRMSDGSEEPICAKKRRETFVTERKKWPHVSSSPNVMAESAKTYKDKSLSMSKRLQLWKAEKRKSNPNKHADKANPIVPRLKRKSCLKENMPKYNKLESESGLFCTPASSKPLPRTGTKSAIKKTRFVTPSSHKNSTIQPNLLQSNKTSAVRTPLGVSENSNAADAKKEASEDDNAKSFRDKSLDMRERLELWLAEKGKTPNNKTPALVKKSHRNVQQPKMQEKKRLSFDCCEENDDKQSGQFSAISPDEGENIEEKLQECLFQLERGDCDSEKVAAKLDLYNSSCPHTSQIANYWLCRAKIAQQQNDYDRVVCLFEQALVFKAQPESTVKDAVCDFVKFMKENSNRGEDTEEICQVPESFANEPRAAEKDNASDELNSSIIKFCLTEATPYRKKFKRTFGKPVLTPVRRSIRLERVSSQHPPVLQEHDLTVRRLEELPEDIQQDLLFKPNFAVRAELNEAWSELQLDDCAG